jgi:hypothetical protein
LDPTIGASVRCIKDWWIYWSLYQYN